MSSENKFCRSNLFVKHILCVINTKPADYPIIEFVLTFFLFVVRIRFFVVKLIDSQQRGWGLDPWKAFNYGVSWDNGETGRTVTLRPWLLTSFNFHFKSMSYKICKRRKKITSHIVFKRESISTKFCSLLHNLRTIPGNGVLISRHKKCHWKHYKLVCFLRLYYASIPDEWCPVMLCMSKRKKRGFILITLMQPTTRFDPFKCSYSCNSTDQYEEESVRPG